MLFEGGEENRLFKLHWNMVSEPQEIHEQNYLKGILLKSRNIGCGIKGLFYVVFKIKLS